MHTMSDTRRVQSSGNSSCVVLAWYSCQSGSIFSGERRQSNCGVQSICDDARCSRAPHRPNLHIQFTRFVGCPLQLASSCGTPRGSHEPSSQITVLVSRMPVGAPISVAAPVAPRAVPLPVPNAPVSGDRRWRVCWRSGCDTTVKLSFAPVCIVCLCLLTRVVSVASEVGRFARMPT